MQSSVVKTLGFNRTVTLVLTCPPFLFAGAAGILTGWSSGRMHERTWHITIGLSVAIVGFVIAASTLNTAGRYIACFIFPVGAYSVNSVIIGWAASTLSQTKEKKAVSYLKFLEAMPLTWGGCACNDQCWWPDRIHIWRVSLARVRRATIWHRVWSFSRIRVIIYMLRLGYPLDAYQGE